jgi:hypothetical protein
MQKGTLNRQITVALFFNIQAGDDLHADKRHVHDVGQVRSRE